MVIEYQTEMEITYLEELVKRYCGLYLDIKRENSEGMRYFSDSEEYFLKKLINKYTWLLKLRYIRGLDNIDRRGNRLS